MAVLARAALKTKYNDSSTGIYKDGQAAGAITEADHRAHVEDFGDSITFPDDFAALATSGADTYTATAPIVAVSVNQIHLLIKFGSANTGAATLNINSAGAVAIKKNVSEALVAGDIAAGSVHLLAFDGTNYQIVGEKTGILTGEVNILAAAVLTANASPVQLVAAPGSGKIIVPVGDVLVKYTYATAAFATNTTIALALGAQVVSNQLAGVIDQTASQIGSFGGVQWTGPATAVENLGLFFQVMTGNPTGGGTSSVKLYFKYRIITL